MNMKIGLIASIFASFCMAASEAVEIKNVTVAQTWPWNLNGVSICYEIDGGVPTNALLVVTMVDRAGNAIYSSCPDALSGETGTQAGRHRVFWDLSMQGVRPQSSNVVFTVAYQVPAGYCIVDLSKGASATSYPVTWVDIPPGEGFNTNDYKTTKLVLRRISPGTFTMGTVSRDIYSSNESFSGNKHKVSISKPFYIGVFEVTQKQWALVMGRNPSTYTGNTRPVESVSYDDIRGTGVGTNWPADNNVDDKSFMGRLRARTGLVFDLPTEAQWEYACRAGTTNDLNTGVDLTNPGGPLTLSPVMGSVGRFFGNANVGDYLRSDGRGGYDQHTTVGCYSPNSWGFYDMHGNVCEWCLDWYVQNLGINYVIDPVGAASGTQRIYRGGGWQTGALRCVSAFRAPWCPPPSTNSVNIGFRLACSGGQ